MKKTVLISLTVVLCALCVFGVFAHSNAPETTAVAAENPVSSPLEVRFLNMLNHNFAYGEDFEDVNALADAAVLSMLSSREGDFISEAYIKGFVSDMYGINITSFEKCSDLPEKQGYVYIVPRGYTNYNHKNIAVSRNEDGTYSVFTDVTVRPHDGEVKEISAVSLFAPDKASPFGYVLISSELKEITACS